MTNASVSAARKKTFVHPRKRPPLDIETVEKRVIVVGQMIGSTGTPREMIITLPRLKCLEKPYADD
jgi:hypothetical protein